MARTFKAEFGTLQSRRLAHNQHSKAWQTASLANSYPAHADALRFAATMLALPAIWRGIHMRSAGVLACVMTRPGSATVTGLTGRVPAPEGAPAGSAPIRPHWLLAQQQYF
jgi:hypothetical protein